MSDDRYVVVTVVSTFRMRYVMHVDDLRAQNTDYVPDDPELMVWAGDTVALEGVDEFSQEHVGENIIDTEIITKEEMLELFDKDNGYLKGWDEDYKIKWVRKTLVKG